MTRIGAVAILAAGLAFAQDEPRLKEVFKDAFLIGAALNPGQFNETDARGAAIVKAHFNTITSENVLKWERVHPKPDVYNWAPADQFVAFGERNKMFIVGHTLVWHSQTPRWVFEDENGQPVTREVLLKRMREHIFAVAGRYRGRIHGWDVVNEALSEDGTLRQSPWLKIIGEDYIAKAFEYAKEADPNAELYYNDYSVENEAKRKGAVELIRKLKSQGIKVTGVGLQGHNSLDWPTPEQQDATIRAFANLGVKVMITELDVDVLPWPSARPQTADVAERAAYEAKLNPYTKGLPADVEQRLNKQYADLFAVYMKHRKTITRVTFWGVTDGNSWKNNFPVRGRTNYPLLFDRQGKPKAAFFAVIEAAKKQ